MPTFIVAIGLHGFLEQLCSTAQEAIEVLSGVAGSVVDWNGRQSTIPTILAGILHLKKDLNEAQQRKPKKKKRWTLFRPQTKTHVHVKIKHHLLQQSLTTLAS